MLGSGSQALGPIGGAVNFMGYNHDKPYQAFEQQTIGFQEMQSQLVAVSYQDCFN